MGSFNRYSLLLIFGASSFIKCAEPEPAPDTTPKTYALANELAEATYPYNNQKFARFYYTGDRVTQVSITDQDGESPFLTVNYLNEQELKICSVYYDDEEHLHDTLIYEGDNLVQIIQTYANDNDVDTYTTDVFFSYSEYGQVTEAKRGDTRVEFLRYEKGNFTQTKFYQPDLLYNTAFEFDEMVSPFAKLGYLPFVLYANNNLQGPGYLANNNIVDVVQDEYDQTRVTTQKFEVEYTYDSKQRPVAGAWIRLIGQVRYRDDFYTYNN